MEYDVGEIACCDIFNVLGPLFLVARVSKEDIALRNQFGKKWDDWAKSVPYSIFPGIY